MANKIDKTEELKLAINAILETSNGHWVSVRDISIASLCKKVKLDSNWTSAVVKGLRETGFCMIEGERGGMRYKMPTDLVLDMDFLIKKIEYYHEEQASNVTKSSDLKPSKPKEPKIGQATKTTIEKRRTHYDIDQFAFYLAMGIIREVEICGVVKEQRENEESMIYKHTVKYLNGVKQDGILNSELFDSPEQLASCLVQRTERINKKKN